MSLPAEFRECWLEHNNRRSIGNLVENERGQVIGSLDEVTCRECELHWTELRQADEAGGALIGPTMRTPYVALEPVPWSRKQDAVSKLGNLAS